MAQTGEAGLGVWAAAHHPTPLYHTCGAESTSFLEKSWKGVGTDPLP